jgi:hypothetical protein
MKNPVFRLLKTGFIDSLKRATGTFIFPSLRFPMKFTNEKCHLKVAFIVGTS